jgi:hypothetical protein
MKENGAWQGLFMLLNKCPQASRSSFFGWAKICIWVKPLWSIHVTSLQRCGFFGSFTNFTMKWES